MGIGSDIRLGARRLRRRPLHAAAVVLTIALAVGVDSTVFSLVDGVLLEPLPYPGADRIVQVSESHPEVDIPVGFASAPNYLDWRAAAGSFDAMALFRGRSVSLSTESGPVYAYGALVTEDFFDVFGVEPRIGRVFRRDEVVEGGPALAILSHGLWVDGYASDPAVLGRTLEVDGAPHTIVGVMPAGFEAHGDWVGRAVDVWRPFPLSPDLGRDDRSWHVAARLADGVDPASAARELSAIQAGLREAFADSNGGWSVGLRPWSEAVVGDSARTLWLLLAAAGLVLLIACANVANLTLERTMARRSEFATRAALGAGRPGVRRLVLVENALAAGAGGLIGVLVAAWSVRALKAMEGAPIPRLDAVGIDWSVVAFTFALIAGVTILLTVVAVPVAMRAGTPGAKGGPSIGGVGATRLASALAVAQLVLCFALLAGAGLLARSFQAFGRTDLGIETQGVTAATVALSWERVTTLSERSAFTREVLERLAATAGIESVGMINSLPLSGSNSQRRVVVPGVVEDGREPTVALRGVSPGYAETMGIPLLAGRHFDEADMDDQGAVLVNRTLAEMVWGDGSPLGDEIGFLGGEGTATVVGILGDVRHDGPRAPPYPELYTPYTGEGLTSKSYVVRSTLPDERVAAAFRDVIAAVDPDQPVREIRTMDEWADRSRAGLALQARLMAVTAALATVLAGLGLFAVLASLVQRRNREIAVRMSVGAGRADVFGLVLRRAVALVVPSLVVGWGAGLALGRAMGSALYQVSPYDPLVFSLVASLFALVAAVSVAIPARRATAVDPARVLRES